MNFYIDGNEIKTVLDGASIEGAIGLVARSASFSYLYLTQNNNFIPYKVKYNSKIEIVDENEKIFSGYVSNISYTENSNIINVQAYDRLHKLLFIKTKGRFTDEIGKIIEKHTGCFGFGEGVKSYFRSKTNVTSFGKLSQYDIIKFAVNKVFGNAVQICSNGVGGISFKFPFASSSEESFSIGENITSANHTINNDGCYTSLKIKGKSKITSGSVISLNKGAINGEFIVVKDRHIYGTKNEVELELKERKISL